MKLTRRDTHALLFSGLFSAAALPVQAGEDWPSRLQTVLDTILPRSSGASLTLSSYEFRRGKGLLATVDLTWPPGFRRRSFQIAATAEDAAIDRLLSEVQKTFAEAIPDVAA